MKKTGIKGGAVGVLAALALSLSVSADDKDKIQNQDPNRSYTGATRQETEPNPTLSSLPTAQLGKTQKASAVIGMEVRNQQNDKLGRIDDLVVDLQTGRIAYAVLSSGGFLGIGDKLIAIPTAAFTAAGENQLTLNMDKQRLASAPSFDKNNWTETPDTTWMADVYRYHGQEPYWDRSPDRVLLRNQRSNESLDDQRERLENQTDKTREQFRRELNRNAPAPAKPGALNPPNTDQRPDYSAAATTPGVKTTEVDNTKRNERDRAGATLTPGDQGTSEADREVTRLIRKSIVVEKGPSPYSVNARNIKIMTVNGVVTLRGVVESQAEKDAIESQAKQVSGVSRIDNQLEVKSTAK